MSDWKELICLGVEGGAVFVYGRRLDDRWVFDACSFNLDLDEESDEVVHVDGVTGVTDLGRLIPRHWPAMVPIRVHRDLRPWFAKRYEAAFNELPSIKLGAAIVGSGGEWTRLLGDPDYQLCEDFGDE